MVKLWGAPVGSETGARLAETIRLSKGKAARIQGMILAGGAAEVRKEIIGIFHSCPPLPRGVVFHAAPDCPDIAGIVQMAGKIRGVAQTCKTRFALKEGLKPAPVIGGVDQAATTCKVFVIGRRLISAHDHGVPFRNDAEIMPDGQGGPGGRPPPVDVPFSPIARPIVHPYAGRGG